MKPTLKFYRLAATIVCSLMGFQHLVAQQPFDCNGEMYLGVDGSNNSSELYSFYIDQPLSFNLVGTTPIPYNSIGYNRIDNFIYGIDIDTREAYRIDAAGGATALGLITGLPAGNSFIAGDVAPNGIYTLTGPPGTINQIDLTTAPPQTLSTQNLTFLPPSTGTPSFADVAYDPTDGALYGFENISQKLARIDPATGNVDAFGVAVPYPTAVGALFFDAFGQLYLYGRTVPGQTPQTELFSVDKATGEVAFIGFGPARLRTDGCSCPFTLEFSKASKPETACDGDTLAFEFSIANSSFQQIDDVDFIDTIPSGLSLINLPFMVLGGTVSTNLAGSQTILTISAMSLPHGIHDFTIQAVVSSISGVADTLWNQAYLSGTSPALSNDVPSDYLSTVEQDDPSPVYLLGKTSNLIAADLLVCPGEPFSASALLIPNAGYSWSGPSQFSTSGNTLSINSPQASDTGQYTVEITTGSCVLTDTFQVGMNNCVSGILNAYSEVNSINYCEPTITVGSAAAFSVGDRVLMIQMQGAVIDNSNTTAFGSITDYSSSGHYELGTIRSISGNVIELIDPLSRVYDVSGAVQLVRVAFDQNMSIGSTVTCPPWNGVTGGVIAIEVEQTLQIGGTIDASGKGFRAGAVSGNIYQPANCSSPAYYYSNASNLGGTKGEGIAAYLTGREAGRGSQANGGGGGNHVNAGGAGGGNAGAGGRGGNQWSGCTAQPIGGEPGRALAYSNAENRIFLGGGGGGGQQNNSVGTPGGAGGGIVIMKATSINAQAARIDNRGNSPPNSGRHDGAGGGGAGGTVLLDYQSISGDLTIDVSGGDGGDLLVVGHGPGGAGGGGIVWSSNILPPTIPVDVSGGDQGLTSFGTPYGTEAGSPGIALSGLQIPTTDSSLEMRLDFSIASCDFADLTVVNGEAPYTYLWSNGGTTEDLANLGYGSHYVTVTDNLGCTVNDSLSIDSFQIDASVSVEHCAFLENGSIDLTVFSTKSPFEYQWNNGNTSEDLVDLRDGTYRVTVTDSLDCRISKSFELRSDYIELMHEDTALCKDEPLNLCVVSSTGGELIEEFDYTTNALFRYPVLLETGACYRIEVSGIYTVWTSCPVGNRFLDAAYINRAGNISPRSFPAQSPYSNLIPVNATYNPLHEYQYYVQGQGDSIVFYFVDNPYTDNCGSLQIKIYQFTSTTSAGNVWWNTGDSTFAVSLIADSSTLISAHQNTCADSINLTVSDPQITDSILDLTCYGEPSGEIALTVEGALSPYAFNWNTSATTSQISNLPAGSYSVTFSDSIGCVKTDSFEVLQPDSFALTKTVDSIACFGDSTGAIHLALTGGTLPYSYDWSNGVSSGSNQNLGAGAYSVTLTDTNGCSLIDSTDLDEPSELVVRANTSDIACFGDGSGVIRTEAMGGVSPYTYAWSNGASSDSISGLPPGTYTVTLTDANNCVQTLSNLSVTQPDSLTLALTGTNPLCYADSNGAINALVSGGTVPYQFNWQHGVNTPYISNLQAGIFRLDLVDSNGCDLNDSIELIEPDSFVLFKTVDSIACFGDSSGAIHLTLTGGTSPYSYDWSNGVSSGSNQNLGAGAYSVTITDANGCSLIDSTYLDEPSELVVSANTSDIACFGDGSGVIRTEAMGGVSPYTYAWSNGANSDSISDLSPGTYALTLTDANNCAKTLTNLSITQPDSLTLALTGTNPLCYADSNGAISSFVFGGTEPYIFNWQNGALSQSLSNLTAGNYLLQIIDSNGCMMTDSIHLTEPDSLNLQLSIGHNLCFGGTEARITSSLSGGTAPHQFNWSNGSSTPSVDSLSGGLYSLTVTDDNNCFEIRDSLEINEPDALSAIVRIDSLNCFGDDNGSIGLSVNGGTADYSYQWSNFEIDSLIANLSAGFYSVTITDFNQCTIQIDSLAITAPRLLQIIDSIEHVSCFGSADGFIHLNVDGGVLPYAPQWNTGDTDLNLVNLEAGYYEFSLTDANNCYLSELFLIEEPAANDALIEVSDISCFGETDGSVSLDVGPPDNEPFSISLNGEDIDANRFIDSLETGYYNLLITNKHGCSDTLNFVIIEPPPLIPIIDPNPLEIELGQQAQVEVNMPLAGTYQYAWSPTSGLSCSDCRNPTVNAFQSAVYELTVYSDDSGNECSGSGTFEVIVGDVKPVFIPNVFSPNGDGINDEFSIFGEWIETLELSIFNRWGELVYFSTNKHKGWDGYYKGTLSEPGVYIYYAEIKRLNGREARFKGSVTLVR